MEKEIGAQRGQMTCPRSHSWWVAKMGFELRLRAPECIFLIAHYTASGGMLTWRYSIPPASPPFSPPAHSPTYPLITVLATRPASHSPLPAFCPLTLSEPLAVYWGYPTEIYTSPHAAWILMERDRQKEVMDKRSAKGTKCHRKSMRGQGRNIQGHAGCQKGPNHRGNILGRRHSKYKGTRQEGTWLAPGTWERHGGTEQPR